MTHARACCCGSSPNDPCAAFNPQTHRLCIRMVFSGIEPNPWKLGQPCGDDCSYTYWAGGSSYPTTEIVAMAGVNRAFTYYATGPSSHPAVVRGIRINASCTDYAETRDGLFVTGSNTINVTAHAECFNGRLRLIGVGIDGFGDGIFLWNGPRLIEPGEEIVVGNQLGCYRPFGDSRTWGHVAIGGQCRITVTAVPISSQSSCAEPEPNIVARKCGTGEAIAVDPATNPGEFFAVRHDGELYQLTSESTYLPAIPVEWVAEQCPEGLLRAGEGQGPGSLWKWGTLLREALSLLTAHKIRHCASCQRRQLLLDHFGEAVGRSIITKLGL